MRRQIRMVLALLALMVFAGCGGEEETIRAYKAPKDPPIVLASNNPAATTLKWTAPPSWKPLPAGQMRVAAFAVNDGKPPVELTVIPLGPGAGELVPNINRWEQQLGLPPSPPEKVNERVKKETINGLEVTTVDLSNNNQRMLAAIVPFAGRFWYFKMSGAADVVTAQKENFDAFIHSIAPDTTPTPVSEQREDPDPAAQHPPAAPTHLHAYKTPQGWRELPDPQPPRILAFSIGPEDQKAEMIATRFAGNNAGSFLDNINRWRNQLGLQPIADARDVEMRDATIGKGAEAVMIELHNPGGEGKPAQRMLVAIAHAGDLWFFKLTGPADAVEKERAAFDEFLKSLEFDAH